MQWLSVPCGHQSTHILLLASTLVLHPAMPGPEIQQAVLSRILGDPCCMRVRTGTMSQRRLWMVRDRTMSARRLDTRTGVCCASTISCIGEHEQCVYVVHQQYMCQ